MPEQDDTSHDAEKRGLREIQQQFADYCADIRAGTSDVNHFMTLSEMESRLMALRDSNTKTYLDVTSSMINEIDERELVKSKKENTKKRG